MTEDIRVLHVDDEPDFADMAAAFLERDDGSFYVSTTTSASTALDRLASDEFDCVVSDYEMPEQNGIEFLEAFREEYPDLPFILYTGKGSEEVASDALTLGATDYLQKRAGTEQYELLSHRIRNAVEQYRSKQAVETTHRRFQTLIEEATDVIIVMDVDGTFDYLSPATERVLGYQPDELRGESGIEYIHPDDREETLEQFRRMVKDPTERPTADLRFDHKDGSWQWLEVRWRNLLDHPVIEGLVVYARDITARKEHEDRFQAFVEQSTDIITVLNPDGTYKYQSPSAKRILGLDPDARVGDFAFERVHPDDREEVQEKFEQALADPDATPTAEYRLQHADGSWRWLEARGNNQLQNPAIEGFVINSRDITERKERERELRERTQQLNGILDSIEAPVWMRDTDGRFVLMNQEFRDLFNIDDEAEIVGMHSEELFSDEIADQFAANDRQAIENETSIEVEETVLTPQGARTYITRITPLFGDDGELYATCGVASDITEQKARERKLDRQNERLEEFAGVVSHDLRNPLSVAEGNLELAREECETDYLEAVARAHDRMEALIDDVLALASQGEPVDEMETVTLDDIVDNCWQNVDTAGADLVVNTDRAILANPGRLQQLLENLLRNAVEHGGENVTVTVGELEDGFYVEDDGPGIPEDDRKQVFEAGQTTVDDGTGFGLAIVEEVVRAHNWEIHLGESEHGGARFEITAVNGTQ